jgi:hypothetical protein
MKRVLLAVAAIALAAFASSAAKPSVASADRTAHHLSLAGEPLARASSAVVKRRSHYRCPRGYALRGRRCYRRGHASRRAMCARGYSGTLCTRQAPVTPKVAQPPPTAPPQPQAPPAPAPPPQPQAQTSLADWAYAFALADAKEGSPIPGVTGAWTVYDSYIRNCYVNTSGTGQCDIWNRAWRGVCIMSVDPYCLSPPQGIEWAWFLHTIGAVRTVLGVVPRVYVTADGNKPNAYICSDEQYLTGVARCS